LRHGASVNEIHGDGLVPLCCMIDYLAAGSGSNITERTSSANIATTSGPVSAKRDRLDSTDKLWRLFRRILTAVNDVNRRDEKGESALHIACKLGLTNVVRALIAPILHAQPRALVDNINWTYGHFPTRN